MHTSRLIVFLLECEFNHVKREKCKKIDKKTKNTTCPRIVSVCPLPKDLKKEKDPRASLYSVVLVVSHHDRSNHDRRIMSENPRSNEISSNKGSRSIDVYFPILFYQYFGSLITGRLMEDGRLIGGRLMEVELDDNHVSA